MPYLARRNIFISTFLKSDQAKLINFVKRLWYLCDSLILHPAKNQVLLCTGCKTLNDLSSENDVNISGDLEVLHEGSWITGLQNPIQYSVSLRIHFECGKIRTRKNSVFGHFSRSDDRSKKSASEIELEIHCN